MIGDSLSADIQGGNNAGIDTIWYNPHHLENKSLAQPTYEVDSYQALLELLDKLKSGFHLATFCCNRRQ